jgi:hypothetical protein
MILRAPVRCIHRQNAGDKWGRASLAAHKSATDISTILYMPTVLAHINVHPNVVSFVTSQKQRKWARGRLKPTRSIADFGSSEVLERHATIYPVYESIPE